MADVHTNNGQTRRSWLKQAPWAAWGLITAAVALLSGSAFRLLAHGPAADANLAPVDMGPVADIKPGQVLTKGHAAVTRDDQGILALRLACPHLGCAPDYDRAKGQFLCPCHGSRFAADGALLQGPAKSGLPAVAVHVDKQGHLIVKPSQEADPGQRLQV